MSLNYRTGRTGLSLGAAEWRHFLAEALPLFGHRNWIVVADAAYPAQCAAGVETLSTGADHVEVVRALLAALEKYTHIRPVVLLDAELPHVPESAAPGIDAYRRTLAQTLGNVTTTSLQHEEIIARLDQAAQRFHVLVLKTDLTLPYTSVFFELECGYWSAEAERSMRGAMTRGQ